jgi:hypothetical protein
MKIEAALEQFLLQLEADGRSPHTSVWATAGACAPWTTRR